MPEKYYEVWKTKLLAERYLNGVRGAIPLAKEQFDVILRLLKLSASYILVLAQKNANQLYNKHYL